MIPSSATQPYSIPLGILVTREERGEDWLANRWRAVGVFLDPPQVLPPLSPVREGAYHGATMPLLLDGRKAMDYKVNLANGEPSVYVVMGEDARRAPKPCVNVRLVSASPFDVQSYRDAGHEMVDRVPMPSPLVAMVRALIDAWPLYPLGAAS